MATTTYTFTPNVGQCATNTTMTVGVGPPVTPTFNLVAPICAGDPLTLPNTSIEGFIGTWSPAINNMVTTTYTFTPNIGQCATNATMTISVNNLTTPTFNPVGPYCFGEAIPPLPITSTNGISGAWAPALNNTATTTYTFTPTSGATPTCAIPTTLTITINPLTTPTFNPVAPICVGDPLTLPNTSIEGFTGTWSPAINNISTTTYTFTPNVGQCATNATMTVNVNPNLTPTFTPLGTYCSGSVIPDLPTTSINGITGDWSPAINNMVTTIYTFAPSLGLCATTTTLSIPVILNITPTFESVGPYCSKAVIPDLPTISLNSITGNWMPSINNTKTTVYTFTPTDTTCYNKINKIITINENPVAGMIFSPQPTDMLNPNILFEDNSNEEVLTSEWHLGDGTIIYDELNFSHTYIDTGTYIIQYFITNQYDCSDSVIKNLIINPIYCTYIPSSFTPNDDGDNDYFYPSVVGGSHYNMKIYDRWGNVIYNEDNGKWDGILNKNLINSGVFPYFITVLDFKDKPFIYTGVITIN